MTKGFHPQGQTLTGAQPADEFWSTRQLAGFFFIVVGYPVHIIILFICTSCVFRSHFPWVLHSP